MRDYAMSFFGKWRQQEQERDNTEKEERHDMDTAITTISARLRFLEALTAELVAEMPPTKRARLLQHLRAFVREQKLAPLSISVPPGQEQEYDDELRRAVQVFIEKNELK
jgi:hypothetical protein